jgi:hypothetical protein
MKVFVLFVGLLFGCQAVRAGPVDWVKRHKRFLAMEGVGLVGVGVHAWGLHRCRKISVEFCDEHYGAAWAGFGVSAGMSLIAFPAMAEGCWSDDRKGKFCQVLAYAPAGVQLGWGAHEYYVSQTAKVKPDLSEVVIIHH